MKAELTYLVVENAPDVCEGIIRRMKPFTQWRSMGYTVSVREAIKKIDENRPALLFLDWGLNGGSAFEVMQHIMQLGNYQPYIIFNTGFQRDNPEIPQELINHYRVDKYLVKPIWEKLHTHLPQYLAEAAEKAQRNPEAPGTAWLDDVTGKKWSLSLQRLICICQHPENPRQRIFYFSGEPREVTAALQWQKCYDLLNRFSINYFITKNRGHLVCHRHIESFERPFVRMKGFPAKIEVVRENIRDFERWLEQ